VGCRRVRERERGRESERQREREMVHPLDYMSRKGKLDLPLYRGTSLIRNRRPPTATILP